MLNYQLIRSHKKHLSLQIKNHTLIARAPISMPEYEIESFIIKKQSWIHKKLTPLPKNYTDILFLGKRYPYTQTNEALLFDGQKFRGHISTEHILEWYKSQFATIIQNTLPTLACEHNFSYNQVRIKKLKSRWGSCSADNNLNFNYLLVTAPFTVIKDVIIHELCHTVYKNHSKTFWKLVYSISPGYNESKAWLKKYGPEVLNILNNPHYV